MRHRRFDPLGLVCQWLFSRRVHPLPQLQSRPATLAKTGVTRRVPIQRSLLPLVRRLYDEMCGEGLVVQHGHPNKDARHGFPPLEDLSANLREPFRRAGATRADLFEDSATTKNVTFDDLRATRIPCEALAGTEPLRIQQRPGHERFETTQGTSARQRRSDSHPTRPSLGCPAASFRPNRPESSHGTIRFF
jgi:integrase